MGTKAEEEVGSEGRGSAAVPVRSGELGARALIRAASL